MKSNIYKTTSFNNHSELSSSASNSSNYEKNQNIRVICKKIVYLIGIPIEIAEEDTLIKKEYLGQYGSIHKIIVNKNGYMKNESNSPTYSSYITYSNETEASLALLSLNNSIVFNHKLNACYGTNKYCNNFLKGIECNNKDCFYLHEIANKNDIIIKNDSQMKMLFIEQQKIATNIADVFSVEQKDIYIQKGTEIKNEFEEKKIENFFPTIDTIYDKKYIQELEKENNSNKKYNNNNNNKEYYYQPSSPNNSYTKKSKINKFSSPQVGKYSKQIDDGNIIEDEDDNEEYILVRQPSRHKKKYGGNKNIFKKKNNYYKKSSKLKFTLEKYKIKYNIREEEINQNRHKLSEFTETISGYNTNESSTLNNQQDEIIDLRKNFYKFSKKSRFSFANHENEEKNEKNEKKQIFIVPDFIKDILTKKCYTMNFMYTLGIKNSKFLEEFLLDEEIKTLNKWANEQ